MPLAESKDSLGSVCGPNNPLGLRVGFTRDGAHGSPARYTARPVHAGWNGILHGGVTFALMDEAEIRADSSEATLLAQADATMCRIDQRIEVQATSNGKEPNRVSV